MSESFRDNLILLSNQIHKKNGTPTSEDIEESSALILTHIIHHVQLKASHFPFESQIKDSEIVAGIVFLYFIANPLLYHLEKEGIKISNSLITRTAFAIYQFCDTERIARLGPQGLEQYKKILRSGETMKNIRDYTETVNEGVLAYVMTQDDRFLDAFHKLYLTIINAQEN